jgi:hypothetical protein
LYSSSNVCSSRSEAQIYLVVVHSPIEFHPLTSTIHPLLQRMTVVESLTFDSLIKFVT